MAAAPIIGTVVGGASSIMQASSQRRAQEQQIAQQQRAIKDQKILSEYALKANQTQAESAAFREQLLNNQAEAIGLIQNEMGQAQSQIASTQSAIAADQQAFMNNQRAVAKEANAQMQAAQVMNTLNQQAQKALQDGGKNQADADALMMQRLALQGAGAADTQTGQAVLERLVQAVASGAINTQKGFSDEQATAMQQLEYELKTAGLEKALGNSQIQALLQEIGNQDVINSIIGQANAQNIQTQSARNKNSIEYNRASDMTASHLAAAGQNAQFSAQQQTLEAQRSAISSSAFGSLFGGLGQIGMGLYQSGIFSGGGGSTAAAAPSQYSIFGGASLPSFNGSPGGLSSGAVFSAPQNYYQYPGANDLLRNIG